MAPGSGGGGGSSATCKINQSSLTTFLGLCGSCLGFFYEALHSKSNQQRAFCTSRGGHSHRCYSHSYDCRSKLCSCFHWFDCWLNWFLAVDLWLSIFSATLLTDYTFWAALTIDHWPTVVSAGYWVYGNDLDPLYMTVKKAIPVILAAIVLAHVLLQQFLIMNHNII